MTDQELLNRLSDALDHAAPDDLDAVLSRCHAQKGTTMNRESMEMIPPPPPSGSGVMLLGWPPPVWCWCWPVPLASTPGKIPHLLLLSSLWM